MNEQKRFTTAIILSGIILFGWQMFFAPKVQKQPTAVTQTTKKQHNQQNNINNNSSIKTENSGPIEPAAKVAIQATSFGNGNNTINISNYLELTNMVTTESKIPFDFVTGNQKSLSISFLKDGSYSALPFEFSTQGNLLKGNHNNQIFFEGYFNDNNIFDFKIYSNQELSIQINLHPKAKGKEDLTADTKSLELEVPSSVLRRFIILGTELDDFEIGDTNENPGEFVKWLGVDYDYHLFTLMFNEKTSVSYKSYESGEIVTRLNNPTKLFNGSFVYTLKNYDRLKTLGNGLSASVDFGFFSIIAIPILRMLQFFHDYFPNYGVAIIILTLFIRTLTFPLQYKSFKSMKKMQKIQPEMAKIKEKFKDNPQKMQKETMELFKRSGANPLGGCLPMLLQLPIFFAFYKVLYNAVELMGAPFIFWINDLSAKDPFYVLPLLMTVAMFFQTKINPSASTDPMQKKVMLFMPIIFGFIMKDFPAGLTLYIFVSTLFGLVQQLFVYRVSD